jgi:hypothetical protein
MTNVQTTNQTIMTTQDLKAGDKVTDLRFDSVSFITSITEKRINMDNGKVYTSSTGRSTSKFYEGHKSFNDKLKKGVYKINK